MRPPYDPVGGALRPRGSLAEPPSAHARLGGVGPTRLALLVLALVAGAALGVARADPVAADPVAAVRVAGTLYTPAAPVARALGDILVTGEGSLTWRAVAGTLTVFAGSPDALWQAAGATSSSTLSLSAPALLRDGTWYLPTDALDTLGIRLEGERLVLPGGRTVALAVPSPAVAGSGGRSEVDDLGHGVPGLRLFAADATGGDGVAVLVADLDLLPLVRPSQRDAIDGALERIGSDKPLLVLVSSLAPSTWDATFVLEQDGRSLPIRYPYRMRMVQGSSTRVGPDAPAAAVLLLPPWFDLYRPITVTWQGVRATVTFRR